MTDIKMKVYYLFLLVVDVCLTASQNNSTGELMIHGGYGFNGCCERPRRGSNKNITVDVAFGMFTIDGIDEKNQIMSLIGWLHLIWQDDFLRWNASQYGYERNIQSDQIWTPDIMIFNAHNNFGKIESAPSRVKAYNNGTVHWYPGGRLRVICKINICLFPFDNQTCDVLVGPWVDSNLYLRVVRNPKLYELFNVIDPEWILMNTDHILLDHNVVVFKFFLTRRCVFHVINIITPLLVLSFLTNLVYILPCESGEKVSLSISILLAYIVLMNLISTILPTNSDQICLLSVYIIAQIVLSAVSTSATVLELKVTYSEKECSNEKGRPVSKLTKLFSCLSPKKVNAIAFIFTVTSTLIVNIVFYFLLM